MSTIREPDVPTRYTPRETMPSRSSSARVPIAKPAKALTIEFGPVRSIACAEQHGHRHHDRHVRVAGPERLVP